MSDHLPPISGHALILLLKKDGWEEVRRKKHVSMVKQVNGRKVIAVIPDQKDDLPDGTLAAILSVKQTGITKQGLRELIEKHGC